MSLNQLQNARGLEAFVSSELAGASEHLSSVSNAIWTLMPSKVRGFANPFPSHSSRPFESSGCLPLDYLRAREAADRQGDISDYPPQTRPFRWREETSSEYVVKMLRENARAVPALFGICRQVRAACLV